MKNILILLLHIPFFIFSQTNPGGITTTKTWFKANDFKAGTTTWSNSVTNINIPNINTGGTSPTKNLSNVNYNPSISFLSTDNNESFFRSGLDINDVLSSTQGTLILVFTDDDLSNNNHAYGFFEPSNYNEFSSQSNGVWHHNGGGVWSPYSTGASANQFNIFSASYSPNNPDYTQLNNGANGSANFNNWGITGANTGIFSIGDIHTITTVDFQGKIAEALSFPTMLTSSELTRVISYLAIKYGKTIDNTLGGIAGDYLATNGTMIWDASINSSYHNDVIGIGRDDNEALLQKQSHTFDDSTRVYISSLQIENILNTGVISSDISYLLMGSNNGQLNATNTSNAEVPLGLINCSLYSRLEREWKVTKTNFSQTFNIDITLNNFANTSLVNTSDLRLLVDDDGDFSNGGTTCYFNGDTFGTVISYSSSVITISGISNSHIANNSIRYITIGSINSLTPLPIELLNFDAELENDIVKTYWSTASEINNDYFSIQRSKDAINFEQIGTVQGAGNSSSILNYVFYDENPYQGLSYYRIKQIDFNGEFSYSDIRTVYLAPFSLINIYPNPAEGSVNIIIGTPNDMMVNVIVFNNIGQKVINYTTEVITGHHTININTSNLSAGIYLFKVTTPNGDHIEKEFIKK